MSWKAVNPEPQKPSPMPDWCQVWFAIAFGLITLVTVIVMTWPPNQQFTKDFGSLILFGINCSIVSSIVTGIYIFVVALATVYEKTPGQNEIHPDVLMTGVAAITTPWAASFVLVLGTILFIFGIGIILAIVIIGGLFASMSG